MLLFLVAVTACGQGTTTTPDTSAASMMPNLSGYTANDTTDLQNTLSRISGGAALLSGDPALAAGITAINAVAQCYQKAGAFQARSYVNNSDVTRAGVIIIINRNVMSDPNTFTSCVLPRRALAAPQSAQQLQPCANTYVYNTTNNQYYIGYVATNSDVCQAFCSALPSCSR